MTLSLIHILGAVAFRVMVYVKSKNAKKFRRAEEYGSARWGCPKDIAPVSYTHLDVYKRQRLRSLFNLRLVSFATSACLI